jgi:murein L,D-transpeptidase YafK
MSDLRAIFFLLIVLLSSISCVAQKADKVLVNKSESKLYVMKSGKPLKAYKVAFGANPVGHKEKEGDGRTPEGAYLLDFKNTKSKFYKSIRVSYPNASDIAKAEALGLKPGGDIMIHGQPNGLSASASIRQRVNWTQGCIALTDNEMDEIWKLVDIGTPIEIISS